MKTTASGSSTSPTPAEAKSKEISRLLFIDNIRVYLTVLVLLHHLMIIYAGTGGWIWTEGRQDVVTNALGGWFCATNQAYFMGLFLLISAYFVPESYDRKGVLTITGDSFIIINYQLSLLRLKSC
jgi:glucan biosynthesis protein C